MRFPQAAPVPLSFSTPPLPSFSLRPPSPPEPSSGSPAIEPGDTSGASAERRLLLRVFERCHHHLLEACKYSSVPPEFLAALTANESGADPKAVRFEPAVYRHLRAVADGRNPTYGGIGPKDLAAEVQEMLHPKAGEFHSRYLTQSSRAIHRQALSVLEDEALREFASSWGFTQIMGYHMVGRSGTVRDLLDPAFHFGVALQLLSEFAHDFQLDLTREFEELFRCWNTGHPQGRSSDPAYVENALRRMNLYRALAPQSTASFLPQSS